MNSWYLFGILVAIYLALAAMGIHPNQKVRSGLWFLSGIVAVIVVAFALKDLLSISVHIPD